MSWSTAGHAHEFLIRCLSTFVAKLKIQTKCVHSCSALFHSNATGDNNGKCQKVAFLPSVQTMCKLCSGKLLRCRHASNICCWTCEKNMCMADGLCIRAIRVYLILCLSFWGIKCYRVHSAPEGIIDITNHNFGRMSMVILWLPKSAGFHICILLVYWIGSQGLFRHTKPFNTIVDNVYAKLFAVHCVLVCQKTGRATHEWRIVQWSHPILQFHHFGALLTCAKLCFLLFFFFLKKFKHQHSKWDINEAMRNVSWRVSVIFKFKFCTMHKRSTEYWI